MFALPSWVSELLPAWTPARRTVLPSTARINPGKYSIFVLPLDQVAEGYRAMDERRAVKTLLRP